jgi:hypothetical protein
MKHYPLEDVETTDYTIQNLIPRTVTFYSFLYLLKCRIGALNNRNTGKGFTSRGSESWGQKIRF